MVPAGPFLSEISVGDVLTLELVKPGLGISWRARVVGVGDKKNRSADVRRSWELVFVEVTNDSERERHRDGLVKVLGYLEQPRLVSPSPGDTSAEVL